MKQTPTQVRFVVHNAVRGVFDEKRIAGHRLVVLDPVKFARGERAFQPFGGTACFTVKGHEYARREFGAFDCGADLAATFTMPGAKLDEVTVDAVLSPTLYRGEDHVLEQIRDTLAVQMYGGTSASLHPGELDLAKLERRDTALIQPAGNYDSSVGPTYRIVQQFDLLLPAVIVHRIRRFPIVHELTNEEIATTGHGQHYGRVADGSELSRYVLP